MQSFKCRVAFVLVSIVVKIYKIMPCHMPIDGERGGDQNEAEQKGWQMNANIHIPASIPGGF